MGTCTAPLVRALASLACALLAGGLCSCAPRGPGAHVDPSVLFELPESERAFLGEIWARVLETRGELPAAETAFREVDGTPRVAKAELAVAKAELRRVKSEVKTGRAGRSALDRAKAVVRAARAKVDWARARRGAEEDALALAWARVWEAEATLELERMKLLEAVDPITASTMAGVSIRDEHIKYTSYLAAADARATRAADEEAKTRITYEERAAAVPPGPGPTSAPVVDSEPHYLPPGGPTD